MGERTTISKKHSYCSLNPLDYRVRKNKHEALVYLDIKDNIFDQFEGVQHK